MASAGDHILLVENDPEVSDLIARQTLIPVGYSVEIVADATAAIKQALLSPPDLIVADLNIPGLSAKDLLVALAARGVNTPLLVIANKGQEQEIIQAFRLGAADYLLWPARDAEVLSVVERVLGRVHEARDREQLGRKLSEANQALQRQALELTALVNIGKAIISVQNQQMLYQRILENSLRIAAADIACLLIRDEASKQFLLTAQRGLPEIWVKKINKPLDDGISALVALSGETLAISGEPLSKFRVANLGKSACVVPIKIQNEVIAMLIVVRKEERPFGQVEQTLLEAVSDYISVSLVNARLFRALNSSAQAATRGEKRQNALLETLRNSTMEELRSATDPIELLLTGNVGALTYEQQQALLSARNALQRLARVYDKNIPSASITLKKK